MFPDSNVLYPISVADLLLRLGDLALHQLLWSEDLLEEVERVLVEGKGLTRPQAIYFGVCIRDAFPHGQIERNAYEPLLIGTRTGRDPSDHVHSAAAVAGRATILLTSDLRGFPKRDLGEVRKATPDAYFTEMLDAHPEEVLMVLHEMGTQRRDPRPIEETLAALDRAGMKRFAHDAISAASNGSMNPDGLTRSDAACCADVADHERSPNHVRGSGLEHGAPTCPFIAAALNTPLRRLYWWARQGSNLRPRDY